jgi:hypothetical protein
MTDSDEDSDSEEEETESFVNKKVRALVVVRGGHRPMCTLPSSLLESVDQPSLINSLLLAQSLNWEPTFFTANITFFGKKDGFNLFISKLVDEKHKIDANSIKWLLKPIVKVRKAFPHTDHTA